MTTDLDLLTPAEMYALADANSRYAPTGVDPRVFRLNPRLKPIFADVV